MTASTAQPGPVHQRNGLGRSALVLGLAGILLGAFAGITWFVAVPLGLLTLIIGMFGVNEKRHHVRTDGATAVIGTIAGAITLALGVWGTGMFLNSLHQSTGDARYASTTSQTWATDQVTTSWGEPHTFGNGITVAVSAPVTFTPAAGPSDGGMARSVVLTVTITNFGTSNYHPDSAVFTPTATFDGRPLSQLTAPDSDVRIPGSTTIQPGRSVGYRVAYELPNQTGDLKLAFRPDPTAEQAVVGGQT
jgi:hypothetical protein